VRTTKARNHAIVTDSAAKVGPMAQTPELSVVIATVGAPAVAETAESVVASAEGREVELIVAWSGPDHPPLLPTGTVVLDVFPAGLAYSRNRGLKAATAPHVAFVDDDEIVDPGWVGALLHAFATDEGPAGVFGPIAPRDERGLPYCRYEGGGEFRLFARGTPPWRIGSGGNMAFRRDVLLAVGGFDPLFGLGSVSRSAEETEAIQRLLEAGHTLAWSPDAVVYHPTKTEEERLASRFPYAYGLGKLARRHRAPALAVRYGREIVGALSSGARARDRRRLRETGETVRGFATALAFRSELRSPEPLLVRAPHALSAELDGVRVEPGEPSFRPDPHYVYRVGEDRILHVYANPTARLRAGLAVRDRLSRAGLPGIPQTFALGESVDALWVLEQRLAGSRPSSARVEAWFPRVAAWLADLGDAAGSVRDGSWWADEAARAREAAPPALRGAVAAALEVVGDIPARTVHGDFQRKNLLLGDGSVGVLDWEHAYDAGPPGLDLLFLAAMARSDRPDGELLVALANGADPPWAPLGALVRRAGVADGAVRMLLLVLLAVWAADEQARLGVPGMPRAEPVYRWLLEEIGPRLAGE
jgi:Glycosyl transferase family 2